MHAFDVLGDPVRRRILELLADGELPAGDVGAVVQAEFGISQPAVSLHLRVLRESGLASARAAGARRLYSVDPAPLQEIDAWLDRYRSLWTQRPDTFETEVARGRHERRLKAGDGGGGTLTPTKDTSAPSKKRKKRSKRKQRSR